jgi:hypothetical protein
MAPLARHVRALALLAIALAGSAPGARAQEAAQAREGAAARVSPPRERMGERIQALREQRLRIRREAPPGFEGWMREMPLVQRRQLDRHLRRMPELQRERFFREWSGLSLHERRALADRITRAAEVRRRELPPRLRTPEFRDRLVRMSPDERREFLARARAWHAMGIAERQRMRARLEKFGALSPDEQRALVDERFARRSAEDRARILGELQAASEQLRARRGEPPPPRADTAPEPSAGPPPAPPPDAPPAP